MCDFTLDSYGISDIGFARSDNEDAWSSLEEYGFFALADGMGGHRAGGVAAWETIHFIRSSMRMFFTKSKRDRYLSDLHAFSKRNIKNANHRIYQMGRHSKNFRGMGTTLCTLHFHKRSLLYSHVGDSRIYRFRKGALYRLTSDHSLINLMLYKERASEKGYPVLKNILTRAIGTHADVEVEMHTSPVYPNDLYLMCTDGLTNQIEDREIASILQKNLDLKTTSLALVERAKQEGGHDNITIVLVKLK